MKIPARVKANQLTSLIARRTTTIPAVGFQCHSRMQIGAAPQLPHIIPVRFPLRSAPSVRVSERPSKGAECAAQIECMIASSILLLARLFRPIRPLSSVSRGDDYGTMRDTGAREVAEYSLM